MTLSASLIADIPRFSEDEQRALRWIFDRILVVGRASYSPWVAAQETRDMVRERADECADAIVYSGFDAVMRHARRADRIARFNQSFAPSPQDNLPQPSGAMTAPACGDGAPICNGTCGVCEVCGDIKAGVVR